MCDPTGVHITRIFVNCSRQYPSPIRSSNTVPVCTSTPIINVGSSDSTTKQQMALLAKEILASQRPISSETFIRKKSESPPPPQSEQCIFISKQSGHQIDFNTGEGIGKKINPNTGTITKKKKQRQSLAVVPPQPPLQSSSSASASSSSSARSSKSSDDGDYLVPMNNEIQSSNEKTKTNFTSYDGIQMFTFTLDDD